MSGSGDDRPRDDDGRRLLINLVVAFVPELSLWLPKLLKS